MTQSSPCASLVNLYSSEVICNSSEGSTLVDFLHTRTLNAPIIVMPHLPQVGHGWGLLGICKSRLTNSPPLGTILCYKSPTFGMGIPKTMKIYGQMPQPWGQIMLTNRYKSPPVARPGVGGG